MKLRNNIHLDVNECEIIQEGCIRLAYEYKNNELIFEDVRKLLLKIRELQDAFKK